GVDGPLTVSVSGHDVTVGLALQDGQLASTAADVAEALADDPAASNLFWVADAPGSDGSGLVGPMDPTPLGAETSNWLDVSGTASAPITIAGYAGDPRPIVRPRADGPSS